MRRLLFALIPLLLSCCATRFSGDYVFPSKTEKTEYLKSYNASLGLWNEPYIEEDVPTSFGTAHVIISGPQNANPLVLLHGTDASSTMWFPNISAFARSNRVYAIDYPLEAGKSVSSKKRLSNDDAAAFYGEVFDHYKMRNITLAGVSRGGWMATYLAVHRKKNISKLVLLSPAHTFTGIKNTGKVLSALRLKFFPSKKNSDRFFKNFSHDPAQIDSVFQRQLYLAYKYGRSKPGILRMGKFSKKELQSLKIPILIFVGQYDIVNDKKLFQKAETFCPNVETCYVKDAGHFLSIDQWKVVNQEIVDFIGRKIEAPTDRKEPISLTYGN
ncbi:MAG: alpha/beta hydrolase [Flavobacterium sp.]|nr:MAG: alpha/beta hydrolase [Flavobacterium sp.]